MLYAATMTEAIPNPRAEQFSTTDSLLGEIGTKVRGLYPEYRPGDKIACEYVGDSPDASGVCELIIRPDGITTIVRKSEGDFQVGVLSPFGAPGRWLVDEHGVGVPDLNTDDVRDWVIGELTTFRDAMGRQCVLNLIPAKNRRTD